MSLFNSKIAKGVRLLVLGEIVATMFNTSIVLPASSFLSGAMISDANAQMVPEMPVALVPVFLAMALAAVMYIRKHSFAAANA